MATIINIETATKNCSVSIARNGEVIAIKELNDVGYSHAEKLHLFIKEVLLDAKLTQKDIDAIAVSKGPGSYTGLRIGVSAAKGICFALDIPLISIDTLLVLAKSITINEGYIVPMIDARRMEVYASIYNESYENVRAIKAEIIDHQSYIELLETNTLYFLGDGSSKCKDIITHKNAMFIEGKSPSSKEMAILSFNKFQNSDFEDVAYFEPFYLKDFVVTPQKKR